eukprot:TRINITY_DN47281_c0_g1_i1.p1 TRINITY_DN47281_c0_g1~~TRINITY_DN47281_c0_g1_i1.p1  ORF type:complete len:926 (+),score=292.54 TRINITY_DN47281_c0_g1_i1:105-2780(+)
MPALAGEQRRPGGPTQRASTMHRSTTLRQQALRRRASGGSSLRRPNATAQSLKSSSALTSARAPALTGPAPVRLVIEGTTPRLGCSGEYVLFPGERANGLPVWVKGPGADGKGERFMYSTPNGFWRVTDKRADFPTGSGWLRTVHEHRGVYPHEAKGMWKEAGSDPSPSIRCREYQEPSPPPTEPDPPQEPPCSPELPRPEEPAAEAAPEQQPPPLQQPQPAECLLRLLEQAGLGECGYGEPLAVHGYDTAQLLAHCTRDDLLHAGLPLGHALALRQQAGLEPAEPEEEEAEEEAAPADPEEDETTFKARLYSSKLFACECAISAARAEARAAAEQQQYGCLSASMQRALWRARLLATLARHAPQRVCEVDSLVAQYADHLPDLVQTLQDRYAEPQQGPPTTLFLGGAGPADGRYVLQRQHRHPEQPGELAPQWRGAGGVLRATPGGRWALGERVRSEKHYGRMPHECPQWQLYHPDSGWRPEARVCVSTAPLPVQEPLLAPQPAADSQADRTAPATAAESGSDSSPRGSLHSPRARAPAAADPAPSPAGPPTAPAASPLGSAPAAGALGPARQLGSGAEEPAAGAAAAAGAPGPREPPAPEGAAEAAAADTPLTSMSDEGPERSSGGSALASTLPSSVRTTLTDAPQPICGHMRRVLEQCAAPGWKHETVRRSGVEVQWSKRRLPDTPFDANRFTLDVRCTMGHFLEFMADPYSMRKYDKNVDQIEVLERLSDTEFVVWLSLKLPLLEKRDSLSIGAVASLQDEEAERYGLASAAELRAMRRRRPQHGGFSRLPEPNSPSDAYCWALTNVAIAEHARKGPKVRGHVRAESKGIGMFAVPLAHDLIRVTYMVCVNPGGKVPAWAVNSVGKLQMENCLRLKSVLDGTRIKGL